MKHARSKWVLAASITATLLLLIAMIGAFLVATEAGTQFVWQRLQPSLPESVTIAAVQGRLIGPVVATDIEVHTDRADLRIDRIELEWSPLALLGKRLHIQRLQVANVHLTQMEGAASPPVEPSDPLQLPKAIALPIEVIIDELSLQGMAFRTQSVGDPFIIDTVSMKLAINKDKTVIRGLFAQGPQISIKGRVAVGMKKNFPLEAQFDWRAALPDYPALNSETKIDGDLHALRIRQKIDTPYGIDATVTIRNLVKQPRFEAELKADPENLHTINAGLPEMAVRLKATGQGDLKEMGLHLFAAINEAATGTTHFKMDAGLRSDTLFINSLTVSSPDHPSRLRAVGQLSLADKRRFHVETTWGDLQWPLQQPRVKSTKGALSIDGRIDDYAIDMNADLQGPEKTDASLSVRGRGTRKGLQLGQIDITSLGGGLRGAAVFGWDPELTGSVNLDGKGLNPGVLFASWPGDLQLQIDAMGRTGARGPVLEVRTLKTVGLLRDQNFSLETEATYSQEKAVVKRFQLSSGATRLQARGSIGQVADISWKILSKDLGSLLPGAKGRLRGEGRVHGPTTRPRVKADLEAQDLAYDAYKLNTLVLDADVDMNGETPSSVSLDMKAGAAPGVEVRKLHLEGQGNADGHALTLVADTDQVKAALDLSGRLHRLWQPGTAWQVRLDKASLAYPKLDAWTLQAPFTGRISAGMIHFSQSCWQSGDAHLCLEGQSSEDAVSAAFEISTLPFSYFRAYLPENIGLTGSLSGSGSYSHHSGSSPMAEVRFNTARTGLWRYDSKEKPPAQGRRMIEFLPGSIRIDLHQGEIKTDAAFPVSETDGIEVEAAIAPGNQPLMDRQLTARVRTVFQDLGFIHAWLPEVEDLKGRLSGDIALSGSLRHPVLKGRIDLVDGHAKLAQPGLELREIGIHIIGEEDGTMRIEGRSVSGQGDIAMDGSADFRHGRSRADIRLKGQNVLVYNTGPAEVEASPDLVIGLRDDLVEVNGEVVIPRAKIQIKKLPQSAVRVSEDQTIARSDGTETEKKHDHRIDARVRITMGEEVFFNGFGLSAAIRGGVLAIGKPGEPTTGTGELKIADGKYEAFGQELDVEKGSILWAGGPISLPGINARAVRRPAEDILVGVDVRGDLRQPEVTLFSDPGMTQGNQLSYLVLGRPLSGASTGEGSALGKAVLALGLKRGNLLAEQIGGKLGLDQLTVESSGNGSNPETSQASLVIGKYLTPKLYINYGIGLFDPVSTLRVQYAISSNWKLVTESSGAASGGDFFYTIETGE